MKVFFVATTAVLTVAFGVPAFAVTGTASGQTSQTPAAAPGATVVASKAPADPNQIICKTIDVTGSHLGSKRTCKTRAAWDDIARASREATESFQNSDTGASGPH